ncbi:ABC transporter permease [Idiomarina xiamenensis]|uniref:ABC transporter permease n=1 Tax=Idiomarina xiamenensis 10-D-4 TaxID=740709 RepID=K2KLX9_9GAMM|nr:FtsX-like permease family protein [Idiomarina xiamenensis]EKE87557.1 ABC transporter permease [Idiomarina xiamenensis 10-D-4]
MSKFALYWHFFRFSHRFMWRQKWMSLTSIISIALVVVVLVGFLSMAKGFEQALTNSGSEHIGIALSADAQTEITSNISQEQVDILQNLVNRFYGQRQAISAELVSVVSTTLSHQNERININLRGLQATATDLHEGFNLVQGRMFRPGTAELIVGHSLAQRVDALQVGEEINLGGVKWRIVGIFQLHGNLFESEVWASDKTVQSDFERQNQFQSVRIPLLNDDALIDLAIAIAEERRLELQLATEKSHFQQQSSATVGLITYIGWPLAIILSVGAFCGTFNSLKVMIDARRQEFKVLRLVGFKRDLVFAIVIYEACIYALLGAAVGFISAWLLFDGLLTSTFGAGFNTVSFALQVDSVTALQALLLALVVGVLSGLIPALGGSRIKASKPYEA